MKDIDSLLRADTTRQNKIEVKELKQEIFNLENVCGSCKKWMIKDLCKRERNHKVTMNEKKCINFCMSESAKNSIKGKELKIKELEKVINQ